MHCIKLHNRNRIIRNNLKLISLCKKKSIYIFLNFLLKISMSLHFDYVNKKHKKIMLLTIYFTTEIISFIFSTILYYFCHLFNTNLGFYYFILILSLMKTQIIHLRLRSRI